jgi:DNA-binding transcriptional ArsR family regulator
MKPLDDHALLQISDYFQALSEPVRLKLLNLLSEGPKNVNELTRILACSQANVSKHLGLLMRLGFVDRDSQGTAAFYRIADESVYELCELVCGRLAQRLQLQLNTLQGSSAPSGVPLNVNNKSRSD